MIEPNRAFGEASAAFQRLTENVAKVIAGNDDAVRTAAICMFADGNLLLDGVPGVGKTTLARALATSIGGAFTRIQATPDLLPSDLTGVSVFDQVTGAFRFVPGPVFANVVLVDEINRTTPRTQSALLEPMEERQVTVEGVTHALPRPHLVMATENPVEQHGTYPLPEGQLDRFALAVGVGYPDEAGAAELVRRQLERNPLNDLEQVLTPEQVRAAQDAVREVHVDEAVLRYAVELVTATRTAPELVLGASPRASVWLVRTSQARAIAMGRDYVLPDDVKALAIPALAHRLLAKDARASGPTCRGVIARLLEEVPVPLHAARGT